MAVTVLKHLKEAKTGPKSQHLKNAIRYILNPEKTDHGLLTGGNCGTEVMEIYQSMVGVKEEFEKTGGRQGYHFVISFAPGECDELTCLKVGREFCEKYLGDGYQYVYAVHTDHAHRHCHIVFNSVNQITGLKYHYSDGDWERYIQPVTDAICREHGLSPLVYDRKHPVGKTYAEHLAESEGRFTWKMIIRMDIDAAVSRSATMEEFFFEMHRMGYLIRQGNSEKHGIYLSYHAPGSARARRDYNLGEGYTYQDIQKKLLHLEEPEIPDYTFRWRLPVIRLQDLSSFQVRMVFRVRQAADWHYFAFLRNEQVRVRKDLLKIDALHEACLYMIRKGIGSPAEAAARLKEVNHDIHARRNQLEASASLDASLTEEEASARNRYQEKKKRLSGDISDAEFDQLSDEIEALENIYPESVLNAAPVEMRKDQTLKRLYQERRILLRILKDADVTMGVEKRDALTLIPLKQPVIEKKETKRYERRE